MSKALIGGLAVAVLGIGGFVAYKVLGKKGVTSGASSAKGTVVADAGTESESEGSTSGGGGGGASATSGGATSGGSDASAPSGTTAPTATKLKGKDKRAMVKQAGAGLKGKDKRVAKRTARKANRKAFDGIDEELSFDAHLDM